MPAAAAQSFARAAWEICKKDARIELRTKELVATAGVFALVSGILASMAFVVDPRYHRATAAGTLWISIFFASVLSFGRIWQRERDESALIGLLVAPIARGAIFVGKALAAFALVLAIELPLIALIMFLFRIDFSPVEGAVPEPARPHILYFAAIVLSGTLALALLGTLFGVMTVRMRARDLVLAVVLFPLLSPVLVCGVAGTKAAFSLLPIEEYRGFLSLMGLFVLVGALIGTSLFGTLVED